MKIILVTGASRGLGQAMALALRNNERRVIGLGRTPAAELDPAYLAGLDGYHQVDLQDSRAVDEACSAILHKHGRIDVLINNAAVRAFKPFNQFEPREIAESIGVNFSAPVLLVSRLLPAMLERDFGRIINIAAMSGALGSKSASLYASTKSALISFSKSLSCDLEATGKNVTANALCPGAFQARNGEKYQAYDYIVGRVVKAVDGLIDGRTNGAVVLIDTGPRRIRKFLEQLRTALALLMSSR